MTPPMIGSRRNRLPDGSLTPPLHGYHPRGRAPFLQNAVFPPCKAPPHDAIRSLGLVEGQRDGALRARTLKSRLPVKRPRSPVVFPACTVAEVLVWPLPFEWIATPQCSARPQRTTAARSRPRPSQRRRSDHLRRPLHRSRSVSREGPRATTVQPLRVSRACEGGSRDCRQVHESAGERH